jgi:hypothetical protein
MGNPEVWWITGLLENNDKRGHGLPEPRGDAWDQEEDTPIEIPENAVMSLLSYRMLI